MRVKAHLDEIAMLMNKVNSDGTLLVVALGGAQPISLGGVSWTLLGTHAAILRGVLSVGSMHNSSNTPQDRDMLTGNVHESDVHIVTRRNAQEQANWGVRGDTRAVLAKHWRKPFYLPNAIAVHFLDDSAPLLATI